MSKVLAASAIITAGVCVIAKSVSVEVSVNVDGTRHVALKVDAPRAGLAAIGMVIALKAVI